MPTETQTIVFSKTISLNNNDIKNLPLTNIFEVPAFSVGKVTIISAVRIIYNIVDGYTLSDGSPITEDSNIGLLWGQDASQAPYASANAQLDILIGQPSNGVSY